MRIFVAKTGEFMKTIIMAAAISSLAIAAPCWAEEAAGDWTGVLNHDIKIDLHLSKEADGHYEGFMKSIDQGGAIIPLDNIVATADTLAFHAANAQLHINGHYDAKWDEAQKQWTGTWTMTGHLPLNFKRAGTDALEMRRRPQEEAIAAGPLPYVAEEVSFANPAAPGVKLAGTFSKPKGPGPFPAVLLIAGSGDQTRDGEVWGHKLLLVMADSLNRAGIAVLRYDKRGNGQSTGGGGETTVTTQERASDAEAAIAWLKIRPDVDQKHVGIIGHSEGADIAFVVAVADPGVSFIVPLAAVGVRGDRNQLLQSALENRAEGQSEAAIAQDQALLEQAFQVIQSSKSPEDARAQLNNLADAAVARGMIDRKKADATIADLTSPWRYSFMRFDPAETVKQVRVPVLAVYGSLDVQCPPSLNVPALRQALKDDADVTIVELPGLNHLLQTAHTGSPLEYRDIEETMAPSALKLITDWAVTHAK
jgi:pimeloyl-ACP methyl ester carboxylesterase